ncbi:ArsR/SmtB family transcription factor [Natranaerobius thermophilus]|uniref:Transcriptional regulator, ArsR family n=1 Tax=Natranaerobius thermophilus (strain ATCC BAA-1301 / DSM 18059 / JW/NM-WN-LF) TaxID=457570 RepID=B2A7P3_NATTJ|nr:metalloregulator ArsR/SmtB family transcription factor [Natranaerobius thermophilus]ACB84345.1 transcriptional regulator, ArsR family [Natranaerobius thermophilus JW/NM-WN-LF]
MEAKLIQILKALSDETRLRILNLLHQGDLCVCELEILLEISQSNASRHLSKLTAVELLRYYKSAKYVYYTINDEMIEKHPFIKQIFNIETAQLEKCQRDNERLAYYKETGYTCDDLKEGKVCFEV